MKTWRNLRKRGEIEAKRGEERGEISTSANSRKRGEIQANVEKNVEKSPRAKVIEMRLRWGTDI